jgi:holdfast attachment protein HfaA
MFRPTRIAGASPRIAAGLAVLAFASAAHAQSASSTASQFKAGYGSAGMSTWEQPVNVSMRDANGNLVITDGVIQTGGDQSIFSRLQAGGAADAYAGAGAVGGGSSAIGNNLSVNVQGDYNTVVVNANQTNNGDVTATTVLNGKVDLNGQ